MSEIAWDSSKGFTIVRALILNSLNMLSRSDSGLMINLVVSKRLGSYRNRADKRPSSVHTCPLLHRELNVLHLLHTLLLFHVLLVDSLNSFHPMLHRFRICTHDTAVSPHLRLFMLDIRQGSLRSNSIFVSKDEDVVIFAEHAVDIF